MTVQNKSSELVLTANADAPARLSEWLESILDEIAFPLQTGQKIMICADEIVTNIANYAYPAGSSEDFSVSLHFNTETKELEITFTDHGAAFDPLQQQAPDVSLPLADRPVGGLGILVVQKMMDRVEYRYRDGCNILTLAKRADNEESL